MPGPFGSTANSSSRRAQKDQDARWTPKRGRSKPRPEGASRSGWPTRPETPASRTQQKGQSFSERSVTAPSADLHIECQSQRVTKHHHHQRRPGLRSHWHAPSGAGQGDNIAMPHGAMSKGQAVQPLSSRCTDLASSLRRNRPAEHASHQLAAGHTRVRGPPRSGAFQRSMMTPSGKAG